MNILKTLAVVMVVALFALASVPAAALDTYWTAGTASWHDPGNWDNGIPGSVDDAYIDNGGTAQITADALSWRLWLGYNGFGAVEQTGGTNTISCADLYDGLHLGYNPGSSGTYNLSAGLLSVNIYEYIGHSGTGEFNQTGGTHTANKCLLLGRWPGSSGTYNLSGTGQLSAYFEYIGSDSTGEFNQTGGNHTVVTGLSLGNCTIASGTYNLSAGELSAGYEYIGLGGTGEFNQTGGTNTVDGYLYIGYLSYASGEYNFYGGSLAVGDLKITSGNWLDIDISEIDAFTVSGDKVGLLDGYIADGKIFDSTLCPDGYLYAVYDSDNDWTTLEAVPEPGTIILIGCALVGLAGLARRRFR